MEKKNRPLTGKITIKNNNKALKINHAIKAEKKKKELNEVGRVHGSASLQLLRACGWALDFARFMPRLGIIVIFLFVCLFWLVGCRCCSGLGFGSSDFYFFFRVCVCEEPGGGNQPELLLKSSGNARPSVIIL